MNQNKAKEASLSDTSAELISSPPPTFRREISDSQSEYVDTSLSVIASWCANKIIKLRYTSRARNTLTYRVDVVEIFGKEW